MSLSHYFSREEFACKCGCGQDTMDYELILVLEQLRIDFRRPIIINSGNRCESHNKKVGGSPNSQHLLGKASDIVVKGIDPAMVYNHLCDRYPDHYGIGNYKTFTHLDVRGYKARF